MKVPALIHCAVLSALCLCVATAGRAQQAPVGKESVQKMLLANAWTEEVFRRGSEAGPSLHPATLTFEARGTEVVGTLSVPGRVLCSNVPITVTDTGFTFIACINRLETTIEYDPKDKKYPFKGGSTGFVFRYQAQTP